MVPSPGSDEISSSLKASSSSDGDGGWVEISARGSSSKITGTRGIPPYRETRSYVRSIFSRLGIESAGGAPGASGANGAGGASGP